MRYRSHVKALIASAALLAATASNAEMYQLKVRFDCWRSAANAPTPAWLHLTDRTADGFHVVGNPREMLPMVFGKWGDMICYNVSANRIAVVADDTFDAVYERAR